MKTVPPATPFRAYPRSFEGIGRMVGHEAFERLRAAHIMITGIGGVGSWIAEALARSGIGTLTLVDLDDICESNINRQVHALQSTVGKTKVRVMAERIHQISPLTNVYAEETYLTTANAAVLLDRNPDFFVDAIDAGRLKALSLAMCRERSIPALTVGGAGGRLDPASVEMADLGRAYNDPLLARVRRVLRQEYDFPRREKARFGIPCVFSSELPRQPQDENSACEVDASHSATRSIRLDCATGFGAATFVTGTFAFHAAAHVIRHLAK
ncbi:MAG: tRNA threonylcarbamoyladenosine dehydratase [Opitutales bacterium]|nr:tRNA threonylcarbamoyladenosine dehydratase [Opitutales bacterium]